MRLDCVGGRNWWKQIAVLIKVRITQLQNRLEKVAKQRNQNRQTRRKADIPTISLVGYTNAGKSTFI